MARLWPEDEGRAFGEVFALGDPCPGEPIHDRYELVHYSPHVAVATTPRLPGLAMNGLDLLRRADPEEYRKVQALARRRAEAQRRAYNVPAGSPAWIILDLDYLAPAQEERVLASLGLTADQVLVLVEG